MNVKTNGFEDLYRILRNRAPYEFFSWHGPEGPASVSNLEYARMVDALAASLQRAFPDVAPGSWAALVCSNGPWWYAALFALLKSGWNVALANPTTTDAAALQGIADEARLAFVVADGPVEGLSVPVTALADVVSVARAAGPCQGARELWARSMAICTTGTTSKSKVAVYRTDAMADQVANIMSLFVYGTGNPRYLAALGGEPVEGRRFLTMLPYCHIYGFLFHLAFGLDGYTLVIPRVPTIQGAIETIREERVFGMPFTPLLWKKIHNVCTSRYGAVTPEALADLLGPQFRFVSCGGAGLDVEVRRSFLEAGLFCIVGIGSTESGILTIDFPQEGSLCSEGYALENSTIELGLLQPDGSVAACGEGELLACRDELFEGYLEQGELKAWERYGGRWFRTGDIVRLDERGLLFFIGRAKNVIVTDTGENVSAEELERHFSFLESDAEQMCVIEFDRRPAVVAYAPALDGAGRDAATERVRAANRELALYKRAAALIFTDAAMPVTPKGGVRKFDLDRAYLAAQDVRRLAR